MVITCFLNWATQSSRIGFPFFPPFDSFLGIVVALFVYCSVNLQPHSALRQYVWTYRVIFWRSISLETSPRSSLLLGSDQAVLKPFVRCHPGTHLPGGIWPGSSFLFCVGRQVSPISYRWCSGFVPLPFGRSFRASNFLGKDTWEVLFWSCLFSTFH